MDSIASVETEVDHVLQLFSSCRESCTQQIDHLINRVENLQRDINRELIDGNPGGVGYIPQAIRVADLSHNLQNSCSQITDSHRKLHVYVSRIGKSIDKCFNAEFAIASDTSLLQSAENKRLLDQAIVQHFLRQGLTNVAKELIREANLSIDLKELTQFDEIADIIKSLKMKNVDKALKWAIKNRDRLNELNSPLEFKIHRLTIIELYKQGIDKQHEIIQYARDNLQHLDPMYNLEIQHLMGGLIYLKSGLENSPYKSFLDPINYNEIEDMLTKNACALSDLSIRSPVSVTIDAGCIALPALLNINHILSNQGVNNVWHLRDELPIEIDLGRNLQFHSTFSCPILKQQSTESNPPMKLTCGHVISRDALTKLCAPPNGNKLKCPYCPVDQVASDAKQIHF